MLLETTATSKTYDILQLLICNRPRRKPHTKMMSAQKLHVVVRSNFQAFLDVLGHVMAQCASSASVDNLWRVVDYGGLLGYAERCGGMLKGVQGSR